MTFPFHLLAPPDPAALPLPHPAHPADGVRLLRGAVYAVPEGSRPLTVGLWLPEETAGPVPVVVFVHGGAWRTGLRDDLGPRFRHWHPGPFARLVRAGFAVACPDYRLSGEAPPPRPDRRPGRLPDLAAHPRRRPRPGHRADRPVGLVGRRTPRRADRPHPARRHRRRLRHLVRPHRPARTRRGPPRGCLRRPRPGCLRGPAARRRPGGAARRGPRRQPGHPRRSRGAALP